jgi:flagellar motor switch/type III secretory pathway protein FliN
MTTARTIESTAVEVQAVLTRLRMPAEEVAALGPDDRLEIEAEGAAGLLVQLIAAGETIAVASVTVVDGRLIATIIHNGPGMTGGRIDQWKHSRATTTD